MANKIKKIPLRTKWLYQQHFQQSGHDCQRCIPRREGQLSYAWHSIPNQVHNHSCMVAIPMQNKKGMLNNERWL